MGKRIFNGIESPGQVAAGRSWRAGGRVRIGGLRQGYGRYMASAVRVVVGPVPRPGWPNSLSLEGARSSCEGPETAGSLIESGVAGVWGEVERRDDSRSVLPVVVPWPWVRSIKRMRG